jgi:UPF0755 protein
MRRRILFIAAGGVLLILGILAYGLIYAMTPPAGEVSSKTITLRKGMTFRQIALSLEREGVLEGVTRFILLGRIFNAGHQVKAGEYCFNLPVSPWHVLRKITRGQIKTYTITIPEGYTLSQIADLLDSDGIVSKEDFLREASSAEMLSRYHIEGSDLEGYLFPDSYAWSKDSDPAAVIQFFLRRFRQVYTSEMAQRAASLDLSERDVLTIASIVERETSDPRERPLVSAVIHNRLRKGIRLQSDPTVIYGIPDFNGNLTRENLKQYTPYNTYLVPGLPPGPICNPGLSSIKAALYPSPVDYLYFVSKNDGTHHFSRTLEEHERAVDKYQRRRKK